MYCVFSLNFLFILTLLLNFWFWQLFNVEKTFIDVLTIFTPSQELPTPIRIYGVFLNLKPLHLIASWFYYKRLFLRSCLIFMKTPLKFQRIRKNTYIVKSFLIWSYRQVVNYLNFSELSRIANYFSQIYRFFQKFYC